MRRLPFAFLLLCVTAAFGAAPTWAAAPAALGLVRLDGDISAVRDAGRYSYVILNAWEHDRIAPLKAANPAVKVLVYKDMSSTRSYAVRGGRDDALLPTGIGFAYAERAHPDWFLRDTRGNRVEWAGYHDHWWMDVGSVAYQDEWLRNVQEEATRNGWDGVFVDNAMADPQWYLDGRTLARYPTAGAYAQASRSFLGRVGPALMARGLLVLPNISDASPDVWADWIRFTSGGFKEHWMKYPAAGSWFGKWGFDYIQSLLNATQRQGKIFIGMTAGGSADVRTMRYARASFLVGWNGGPAALVYTAGRGVDPWSSEWTTDVGTPAGPRVQVGATGFRRDYTRGVALINVSEQAAQSIPLGRSYLTPEGLPVTSLTLGPRTGIVLRLPPGVVVPAVTKPPPKPTQQPAPPARRLTASVSLHAGARAALHGRVHARGGHWRVTVYWQRHRRWRIFAQVRTTVRGHFRVQRQVRANAPIRFRAVARTARGWAESPVLQLTPE